VHTCCGHRITEKRTLSHIIRCTHIS
jgi:hypothetical protein